jgi:2-desacetyl-2-hydroxyethyl bacteriochlorophyllide A dehydrogenase
MTKPEKKRQSLFFTGKHNVEIRTEDMPALGAGQVLIETLFSAISAGTEMLVYRGQLPSEVTVDAGIEALAVPNAYPMRYGYACVGRITHCGTEVQSSFIGKTVFVFHPHSSHIVANIDDCLIVAGDIAPETALFLPNMETAVNLVQDVRPILGERGVILGQGIVGLLVSALISEFPLASLFALDRYSKRRELAASFSGVTALDPELGLKELQADLFTNGDGADFVIELTGSPEAINTAIDISGYGARIIIGSWYGTKTAAIDLGGKVHRNRLTIYSSQVSTIAPELSARWDKERRFSVVWEALRKQNPERFISHRVPFDQAKNIYQTLDSKPDDVVQAILVY